MSWEMGEKETIMLAGREGENTHERQGGWNLNVKTAKQNVRGTKAWTDFWFAGVEFQPGSS